ncbi:MAG TPA: hypothetical protein VG346_08870 [Acidimicrobiales bacterium]|jgi:hypothetical protein|nr:hypothetical protein [Acidimicrobiales bacterium]
MEDEEAWTVPDVYLLTEGTDGEIAVPRLTLTFRDSGLELDKADGESVWDCDWSELQEMTPVERSVLPDGREGVVMVVVERDRRRRHRFVLATDDAEATEGSIRGRAGTYGLRTRWPRPAVSRLLIVALVGAASVTLALLLLSADHVIHF